MSVAIVGTGLVTPSGDTPMEHAFFLRASVPSPPPSPFRLRRDGSTLHVRYCRRIGAAEAVEQRLLRMAEQAIRDALRACGALAEKGPVPILLSLSKERPGVSDEALGRVCAALASHGAVRRFSGDAGVFEALREASAMLRGRAARVVVVAAIDTFISIDALDEYALRPPSEWDLDAPAPAEGAAAVALAGSDEAQRNAVAFLGTLEGATIALGRSNDDNGEPVDGSAMTTVLRELPTRTQAGAAFGPFKVDLLRQDEWHLATARNAERFGRECRFTCLESHVGRLGAASGMANLVYGLAVHRHRTGPIVQAAAAPFYAWAISPDGTRGAALVRAGEQPA